MVYALIIHTLVPGPCRLLYSSVFVHEPEVSTAQSLQEYCQIILQPSEAILKVDRVVTIIHQFLPNGQLLFMNTRYLRQMEKELEQVMSFKRE
ncbi:AP-5 complex subunit sigma-1-like [Pocillopora damicornis]|uniref:AP-5 complex subunit sigma-1-like n=1 Tax=Pocillopora damicornis TaxID=46731 RepID=UPI000F551AEC|nr:AP-5 complex subunit sigma-1-like [Pocillopora damicornis]